MSGVTPVCASLSRSAAQPRATLPVRESVRIAGSFLPTPQPPSAALPSAEQRSLPLAALRSAAVTFTPRFAATRQRCRKSERTPNHALQRTAPRVTVAAISSSDPSRPLVALSYVRCLFLRSAFAATAPRSAVAELGVVRRSRPSVLKTMPHETNSEANVTSSPSGYQSLVLRASAGEASAATLAAWRTSFESLDLSGFGDVATLAAMRGVVPVCASLSQSAAQPRSTSSARSSVRLAGVFLPTPQPPSAALPSAEQHSLPLAAERSAALTFTRRFAATRQRCRKSERTPNHALQRTAPRVTVAAISGSDPSRPSVALSYARCRFLRSTTQLPRRAPQSLSLGSLGVATRH